MPYPPILMFGYSEAAMLLRQPHGASEGNHLDSRPA